VFSEVREAETSRFSTNGLVPLANDIDRLKSKAHHAVAEAAAAARL
jgi:hypothetical protein